MTFMAIIVEGNQPFSEMLKESRGSTSFYQQSALLLCFDINASLILLYLS